MATRSSPANRGATAGWLTVGLSLTVVGTAPAWAEPLNYITLDDGTTGTFLTGIRGDNIVGNIVIPGGTGGILYRLDTGEWLPFPVSTPNGSNFPGATSASPYGPSFGSPDGILRVVGSYKTDASPYDLSYLFDAAAAPGKSLTDLVYPDPDTEFTIAHSTFGNTVVGNWDTGPLTGNAFVYDIPTGTFTTNNKPGALSTTAYGVWGDKIAGGYGAFGPDDEPGFEHGYIYDTKTDTWTTYDHPGAFFTHFEGITGAGRKNEYNLVSDWIDGDGLHAAVLHVEADGTETWIPIEVPGAITTSANSIYQGTVVGIYTDVDGIHGYQVTIPGIYNPLHNAAELVVDGADEFGVAARAGDDVVNDGIIRATGVGSRGIGSRTYGVVTNLGTVEATGAGSVAAFMRGDFGTLLNGGLISATPGADAVLARANGTVVVNKGVIDGRVRILAGPDARFENNGWLGVSAEGAGIRHEISGVFAQTPDGVLAVRVAGGDSDTFAIDGAARLDGTVAALFQPGDLVNRYKILSATDEATGEFDALATYGLPGFLTASLDYSRTAVSLSLRSDLAGAAGLSRNERAVGGAFDAAFNAGAELPEGISEAILALPQNELPAALDSLSGEIYASTQSVLFGEAMFVREALLGRLRGLAPRSDASFIPLGYAEAPVAAAIAPPSAPAPAVWAQAVGSWGNLGGDGNASAVDTSAGGLLGGAEGAVGDLWTLGVAFGYSQSNTTIDSPSSSALTESGLIAGYAGADLGLWKLRTGAAYGFNFIDANRSIGLTGEDDRVHADYQGGTGQLFAEAAYATSIGAVAVEPFAGLAWVHVHTDAFTEAGGAGALKGYANSSDVGYATLGVRLATDVAMANGMVWTPRLSLAWQSAFGDTTPEAALAFAGAPGTGFTVAGVPIPGNSALINAGADLRISPSAKLGLAYFGALAGDASLNSVEGTFAWSF